MAAKRFHLGWFTTFGIDEWNDPFASGGQPWDGEFYVDMAKALERACFDYIMFEDTLMLSEAYGGTTEEYLKAAIMVPKHDPLPLAAVISAATKNLGVVTTMSTMAYPPFLLARLAATMDHIAKGRFGWNIVTSGEDTAAQNFGLEKLPPRELRYDMADEYLQLVGQLFESWDPDAIVMDRETDTYADFNKVRPIHFKGKYFSSRGPLNTAPMPQGRPAYVQAGGSPKGRQFAAKYADSIIATANGIEGMKAYRDDVRARAAALGRNPDDIKVLFLAAPILADTIEEARAKTDRAVNSTEYVKRALALFGSFTDIDFSVYDLDKPLPEKLVTNGEQGSLDKFQQWGSGKTLRQLAIDGGMSGSVELIGTPDSVADQMGEVMEAVGGDGFLITAPFHRINRKYLVEVTEGLIPALQRRGLTRSVYTQPTLRQTLKEF
ncbi:NtaA/DmoA family FMN-dependent monooxygenase [Kaistia dalseonensis]|uniref:FMN-dependent oxidoreductase (Nitrilotriacetate monooxygenase family) n=1 Tax=Kaistia dalseonensis TaxID=410840 RepID=A0ABU0H0X5_9HYPH|nr:NtaA/DmoA family FMN-dependent monooxygenase [Kaistia dalseonensis]MCX5493393.1 NtaA/DmoA family FMN-dependent monooxygenase [Kaistia dalseonensis]MDQ0435951.1 FMN-dependent oxidoreductase (nitrilotriacetate monooxygenase family) [Kaistia dalseonensis]